MKQNNSAALALGADFIDQCFGELDLYKAQIENHVMMDVFIAHDSLIKRRP